MDDPKSDSENETQYAEVEAFLQQLTGELVKDVALRCVELLTTFGQNPTQFQVGLY